jgi:hypothetical protein
MTRMSRRPRLASSLTATRARRRAPTASLWVVPPRPHHAHAYRMGHRSLLATAKLYTGLTWFHPTISSGGLRATPPRGTAGLHACCAHTVRHLCSATTRVKWLVLLVAFVAVGAFAGFGIYAWASRDDKSAAADQAQARAYANQLAALCDPACEIVSLRPIAPGVWKLHELNSEGERVCVDIIVDRFRSLADGDFAGVVRRPCWGR